MWYARFLSYVNMPGKRTFRGCYELNGYGGPNDHGTISQNWRDAIKEFEWKSRAAKFDIHRETARLSRHRLQADTAYDALYDAISEAIKTLVAYSKPASTKGGRKIVCPPEARVRLNAALEILDRLGISKRAARPMYAHSDETDEPKHIVVSLEKLSDDDKKLLAGYGDDEPTDYDV